MRVGMPAVDTRTRAVAHTREHSVGVRRSTGEPSFAYGGDQTNGDLMGVATRPGPTATGESDAEIMSRVHGDPAVFATLFDRYYPAIHGYATRRLGWDLAEDVAAETFLVAFDRRGRYDPAHSSARPWLFGIAANLIAGHQRSEARRYQALARTSGRADSGGEAGLSSPDRLADRVAVRIDAQAVRGRLALALRDIAPSDRDVLLLVAWAGLSCEETAQALEIPPGTARSRLHRARRKLQAALGGIDPTAMGEDIR
jgi:RNA polymerase sigma factor (sigma-70 family)